jgi:hypothetical protein
MVGLARDRPVTFPSRNIRQDLASRLDYAHGYSELHHDPTVNGRYDTSGRIVSKSLDGGQNF